MRQNNQAIRREARACNVPLWRIAVRLGISEPTMTRRLRTERSLCGLYRQCEKLLLPQHRCRSQ